MSVLRSTSTFFESGPSRRAKGSMVSFLGTIGLIVVVFLIVWSNHEPAEAEDSGVACRAVFNWLESPVFSVAWSPDGRKLASSGFGPVIRVWELDSSGVTTLESSTGLPRFVLGWAPDGSAVVVGGLDVPVESWDLADRQTNGRFTIPPKDRTGDGRTLIEASRGNSVRLWGPMDGRLKLLPAEGRTANSLAYSPDGRLIASGNGDGTFRIFDRSTGTEKFKLQGDPRGINSVTFTPDGSRIATGGGGPARIWDASTGQEMVQLGNASGGSATVALSVDGRRLARASWDGSIWIWDIATGREQARIRGHVGQVLALAWSPDGKLLASGSYDGSVRLWDVAERVETAPGR